jgi:Protein of unknown function (DUF2510)
VTDPSATPPAAWYPDPAGSAKQRWWDGSQWTDHFHDPALEVYGAVATPMPSASTPVYGPYIWLITLVPLLSVVQLLFFDMTGYVLRSTDASLSNDPTASVQLMLDPAYLMLQASSWVIWLVSVLFAVLDSRRLARAGVIRPFHWAWTFLYSGIYVIGRSIVVKRRVGRGLAPVWVFIGVTVFSFIAVSISFIAAMTAVFERMPLGY